MRFKNTLGACALMTLCAGLSAMDLVTVGVCNNSEDYEQRSAEEKMRLIQEQIIQGETDYKKDGVPPFKGPGLGFFDLMSAEYVAGAYDPGDFMEADREKLIHGSGVVIQVSFTVNDYSKKLYSGIFKDGSKKSFMRISLAVPPESDKCVPGLALKFLRDGRPSENIMAMYSLNGQSDADIFAHDFTTVVPDPGFSFKVWLLEKRFQAGLDTLGKGDLNTKAFSLDEMAKAGSRGQIHVPKAPFMLIFRPSEDIKSLTKGITFADDFRTVVAGKGKDLVLYEVYALEHANSPEHRIGSIIGISNFSISKFADETLRFQHPMMQAKPVTEGLCPFSGIW